MRLASHPPALFNAFAQTLSTTIGRGRQARWVSSSEHATADTIQGCSVALESADDSELLRRARNLRDRCQTRLQTRRGSPVNALDLANDELIEASALAAESVRRSTGKRLYMVQLLAGTILATGRVAEMQTGEGKTLTSAIPIFALSLLYPNVHVATPNAYLAERDYEELRGVYERLGATVGLLKEKAEEAATRRAYEADITYGAGYAFGFDYLRDDLTRRRRPEVGLGRETFLAIRGRQISRIQTIQGGLWASLIDEIDSVLLDEALTPLILSLRSPLAPQDGSLYASAHRIAAGLESGEDFHIDESRQSIRLTPSGLAKAERRFADEETDLRRNLKRPWTTYVANALQAQYLLAKDEDFVVLDNKVQLVDPNTGRIFSDRSWRAGLQQAVEQRVGAELTSEKASAGRITRQAYYRRYQHLCGMTGTAIGAEGEFKQAYELETVRIPLNRPSKRQFLPDRFFVSREAKFEAAAEEIRGRISAHQPVLVGTRTIADSEYLSSILSEHKIDHVVLNGKQDQEEAEIIAEAGRAGRVTVATNMAGRGTDISPDAAAIRAGGLHVLCLERHQSRRIDLQFAGRSGRAGAPGSCEFFVSAEDELPTVYGAHLPDKMKAVGDPRGECRPDFSKAIGRIQRQCEQRDFRLRKMMMQTDKATTQLIGDHSPRGIR